MKKIYLVRSDDLEKRYEMQQKAGISDESDWYGWITNGDFKLVGSLEIPYLLHRITSLMNKPEGEEKKFQISKLHDDIYALLEKPD